MKKLKLFFALFAMLALGVGNAWAEDVTYVFKDAADNPGNANDWLTADIDSYTSWSATKGGSNNPKYYNTGTGLRVYNGGKFTITSSKTLSSITLTFSGTNYTFQSSNTNTTQTVTPNAKSYEWSVGRTCRLQKIEITYAADAGGETPEPDPDPTPDPEPDPDPAPGTGGTGTINFNSSAVKINAASVTGNDDLGNTWTITTVGTTSYTASNAYYQVGSGSKPATSITFTTTLPSDVNVTAFSAKFGGFNGTAGAVTLKVDDTSVGTGSLNATSDVTISNSSQATGKKLTVTLTGIAKGVKVYYISYTYTTSSGGSEPETPATELTDDQFAWSAATAEATMGASNTFPTLTNTLPVSVTYESSNTAAAAIAADGTITLVAPGTTTISAKFAGGEVSGTTYAPKTVTYALTVLKAPATPTDNVYVKVTSTAGITDGEYLIVYEAGNVAFNGALEALDAVGNTLEVTINNNTIAGTNYIDAATFTIDVTNGTILSASGKYIGKTANSNGLDVKTTAMTNTFAIDANGNAVITGNTAALRYNKAADQKRFRYYKDGGGSQEKIALYKKASKQTVTIATCTNGSVSAKMGETALATNDQVLSGITITLDNEPATGYKLAVYDVYKTDDNTTKVTVTDDTFIMPEFDVTISATFVPAKTLTSIEITSAATQSTFWQGETFNYTGLEVTAHFDGAADEVVTPTVTGSTATAGTQTVTVSYEEGSTTKTATYNITVKAIPNTKETAYTIADAFDIIDKLTTADGVFIKGIVSQVDSYNSTYKSITYWISADGTTTKQLQVYSGKGLESADFTAVTDVAKGAQVIVCGNLKKHNTTYEFDYNNYLAAYTAPTKAEPGIAYETTEYTANVNEAFTAPTLTNPNGLAVTYSSSDLTLATVDATTGAVTILDKAGKVTITATFAGNETYLHGTASYNITISDPSISEATFVAATDLGNTTRGEGSIAKSPITFACSDGVLGNASEYRLYQDANITFAAENGYAITKVVITSTASGTSQYGPGLLSTENGTYSVSDKTGIWVGEAQTVTFTATAQSRAKLITVYYKTDNRQDAGLAWSTENVSITLGDAFTAPTLSNPNGLTLTCTSDNENLATVTNAGVVTLKSGVTGKATITAKFDGNSNYKDATVTCTIIVNPKTEIVVILAQYNGQWYALKNVEETAGKVLAALEVTYFNGTLYNVADADKATIEWQRAAVTDGIIFKNGENYIYGTAGSTDLKLSTTECTWTLVGTTYMLGDRTFLYRAQANGFKNYNAEDNAGTADYSALPVVTAPVYVNLNTSSVKTVEKGIFSVADGKFVQFSTGNLQYEVGTNTWSFAENQYDYVGEANIKIGDPNYEGKIDMFGWSTDDENNNYGVNPNNVNELYDGTFQDWGTLVNEADWYTLSADEWKYLLNTRANAANLKQIAKVNNGEKDIVGIMLFPDAWAMPADVNVAAAYDDYFKVNIYNYTLEQWAKLEAAGAVFLPAAGRRTGGYGNMINYDQQVETREDYLVNGGFYRWQDNTNIYCYYWTSTINESKDVSYLHNIQALGGDEYTIGTGAVWGEKGRYGQSVRLVKAIKPDYKREVRQGYYGTICLENGGQMIGASLFGLSYYNEAQGLLYMDEVRTTTMTAGNPYIFLPNEGADTLYVFYDATTAAAKTVNGLVGYLGDENMQLPGDGTNYILQDNKIKKVVGGNNSNVFVTKNRAYIVLDGVSDSAPAPAPGVRRVAIGQAPQVATGMENVDASAQPVKMIINGQLYILRGEKMYDAQGKLVK